MARHSKARHRLLGRHETTQVVQRAIEMVDARTGTAHFLTVAAAENGMPHGPYTTICREEILPAALVAREARYCRLCAPLPTQRSRGPRR